MNQVQQEYTAADHHVTSSFAERYFHNSLSNSKFCCNYETGMKIYIVLYVLLKDISHASVADMVPCHVSNLFLLYVVHFPFPFYSPYKDSHEGKEALTGMTCPYYFLQQHDDRNFHSNTVRLLTTITTTCTSSYTIFPS